ncbi:DNL-type zinc finger protein [Linum grandiflorum]
MSLTRERNSELRASENEGSSCTGEFLSRHNYHLELKVQTLQAGQFSPCSCFLRTLFFYEGKGFCFPLPKNKVVEPQRCRTRIVVVTAAADDDSGTHSETEPSISADGSATIDIKLPRRSLLVKFTCNDCGERTQRLVSRLAYERGLVFVQCAGCEKYHKLVDNLGLIVEYDLREEIPAEPTADKDS